MSDNLVRKGCLDISKKDVKIAKIVGACSVEGEFPNRKK